MKRWTIGNLNRHRAQLGLDDGTVSGVHASLTQTDDGRWIIEDLNSTNGTFRLVNGKWQRVRQTQVGFDDDLRFGRVETTVRRLLKPSVNPSMEPPPANPDVIPWTQDLAQAFSEIRSMAELKRNVFFVLDLISSPARNIMRCVVRRGPVKPFSFMVFGGAIYTVVTAFGLTIPTLLHMNDPKAAGTDGQGIESMFLTGLPLFIVTFLITLIFNMFPFPIFRYFTLKERNFSDYMRLTAVITGMSWMLLSFAALLWNQALSTPHVGKSPLDLRAGAAAISSIVTIYNSIFAVIAQKNFWRITYGRTLWCYVLTFLAFIPVLTVVVILAAISLVSNRS